MKTVKVSDPSIAEEIRKQMVAANPSSKGLMPAYLSPTLNSDNNPYTFDLNDIKRDSRLIINSDTLNNPITVSDKWGFCISFEARSVIIQLVFDYWAAASLYSRSYNNSRWSSWTKIK